MFGLFGFLGCVVVVVELGVFVGVDCIEGIVFGNGECIGNVDFVIFVFNCYF